MLTVRPATIDDAPLLRQWRNDPDTRRHSHQSHRVSEQEHRTWLEKSLVNPNRKLVIVHNEATAIGTVRMDWDGTAWELSWTVAPESRGQGWAKAMIDLATRQLPLPWRAEVLDGNPASGKLARACGMVFRKQVGNITHYQKD